MYYIVVDSQQKKKREICILFIPWSVKSFLWGQKKERCILISYTLQKPRILKNYPNKDKYIKRSKKFLNFFFWKKKYFLSLAHIMYQCFFYFLMLSDLLNCIIFGDLLYKTSYTDQKKNEYKRLSESMFFYAPKTRNFLSKIHSLKIIQRDDDWRKSPSRFWVEWHVHRMIFG